MRRASRRRAGRSPAASTASTAPSPAPETTSFRLPWWRTSARSRPRAKTTTTPTPSASAPPASSASTRRAIRTSPSSCTSPTPRPTGRFTPGKRTSPAIAAATTGAGTRLREERHARMLDLGVVDRRWPLSPRDPDAPSWEEAEQKAWQARRMEVYAAQVEVMDQGIGRIVARSTRPAFSTTRCCSSSRTTGPARRSCGTLRAGAPLPSTGLSRAGPRRSTVQRGNDPGGDARRGTHLSELRASLGERLEHALPALQAAGPRRRHRDAADRPLAGRARTAPGSLSDEPGHVVDLMPTLLDLGGASHPRSREGDPAGSCAERAWLRCCAAAAGAGAHLLGAPGQPRGPRKGAGSWSPAGARLGALRPGGGPHGAPEPGRGAARARARAGRLVRGLGGERRGGSLALGDPSSSVGDRGPGPGRCWRSRLWRSHGCGGGES